jgi:NAD(P)H-nitrite reductase large subunit
VATEEEALEYCAAFIQLYREEARYLERTAPWIERVGVDYVKARVVEDEAAARHWPNASTTRRSSARPTLGAARRGRPGRPAPAPRTACHPLANAAE